MISPCLWARFWMNTEIYIHSGYLRKFRWIDTFNYRQKSSLNMDKYSLFRISQETKNIPFTLTTYFVRLPIRSPNLVFILNLNLDCFVYEYFFGLNPVKFSQFSFLLYGITLSIKYLIRRFRLMLSPLRKASKSNVNGPIDRYMTHIMH